MPIRLSNRKSFTWRETDDGKPIAVCARFGAVVYTLICPGCGCMHEIRADVTGDSFDIEANCLLRKLAGMSQAYTPVNWRRIYDDWCSKYPQARDVTTMRGELLSDHEAIGRYCNNADIQPHAPAPTVQVSVVKKQQKIEREQAKAKRAAKAKAKAA